MTGYQGKRGRARAEMPNTSVPNKENQKQRHNGPKPFCKNAETGHGCAGKVAKVDVQKDRRFQGPSGRSEKQNPPTSPVVIRIFTKKGDRCMKEHKEVNKIPSMPGPLTKARGLAVDGHATVRGRPSSRSRERHVGQRLSDLRPGAS